MSVRPAFPTELGALARELTRMAANGGLMASALPGPLASGAIPGWPRLLPGLFGLRGRVRVHVEHQRDRFRAIALVYEGRRDEWVVISLAASDDPDGADAAFRLLSALCASAARHGMHRVFASVPDTARARESFFQAGFYSYTRETWFVARRATPEPARRVEGHFATGRDAHDLFRFYAATTPHAVQRAEQLQVEDFDVGRRAGAFDPPHIGGNPLGMKRSMVVVATDGPRLRAYAASYRGLERHPHVCKVRTDVGDVDLARELVRGATQELADGRALVVPVRSYEEHVARALAHDGFEDTSTTMLFVKELAVRVEEPAFRPVVAR
ncbi:MAG TPA: hypothetical protein VFM93_11975 [Candidatus Limnocylindria bacterium]|nr:hypothetical protein [Candidatus Limnocylindria bacterium]